SRDIQYFPTRRSSDLHGIYTSTTATGVGVLINGVNRTAALGGKFNADRSNLNITPYLTVGQWNEIRLTSERLGRIDASVFVQARSEEHTSELKSRENL